VLGHWFFEMDASQRSILFPRLELEDVKQKRKVRCMSMDSQKKCGLRELEELITKHLLPVLLKTNSILMSPGR